MSVAAKGVYAPVGSAGEVWEANAVVSMVLNMEFRIATDGDDPVTEAYKTAAVALNLDAGSRLPTGQRVTLSLSGLARVPGDGVR